uniref:RHS repeat domain-containing protein n=1 Tax=Dyadobacter sp. TaxID=1914288 RepID=UPI003F6E49E6
YNSYGDVTSVLYPSGFGTIHGYDANGYQTTIKNSNSSVTLYTNTNMNGLGQNTGYALGNGKSSTITYQYGIPKQLTTAGVQNLELIWDYAKGNLDKRKDYIKNKEESFTYDNLNRLLTATVLGKAAQTTTYQPSGNISSKSDAGLTFSYHPTKSNALTGVTSPTTAIPLLTQEITYTAFNQPEKLIENGSGQPYELTYTYGADYQRLKGVMKKNAALINTHYYFGPYEKDVTPGVADKHLHYISSPAGLIAIVIRENGADQFYYTYTDHLGSLLTLTAPNGAVILDQNFDAWGRLRNPASWDFVNVPAPTSYLYRGFTGHEHLTNFNLINMNGRMYDPLVGRVLSVDNYVQDLYSTQGYNRYSYVMNNPLKYTDPSGEAFFIIPQIGFGKGGFSLGLEIGVGVPGVLSASVTGGYNFKSQSGYWSVQGSAFGLYGGYGSSGWFAGYGYRYAGLSFGVGYGTNSGWNAGLSYGGTVNNFNGSAGIGWSQKGGFDWNVSAAYTYTIEKPKRTMLAQYNLEGASSEGLHQRASYDCLICATEYLEGLPQASHRSYEEIMAAFGSYYDPSAGTNTMAALKALYGVDNVTGSLGASPLTVGRELQKGNAAIIAQNNNHAIVPVSIELWQNTYESRRSKTYFNMKYMDPANGKLDVQRRINSFQFPTFIIRLKK